MGKRAKKDKRKSEKTSKVDRTRPLIFLLMGSLLVAGIIMRVHLLDRSLWLDEAWVANSIRAASLHEAIYYADWLQTTPPLFIALSRLITALFGTSNLVLRALPALSGIASVILISFLALRLLRFRFAMMAILLFVFSPRVILYSQSLKQYSTDVLSTIGLIALGYFYIEKRSDQRFYLLLSGFVALAFLSYPVAFFLPFVLYCAGTNSDSQTKTDGTKKPIGSLWPRVVLVLAVAVAAELTNYFLFISPNKTPVLAGFFSEDFFQGHSLVEFVEFYSSKAKTLAGIFFFGRPGLVSYTGLSIVIIGFTSLWISGIKSPRSGALHLAILLAAPIVCVVALNIIGFFPLPGFNNRLLLFVVPIASLAFGFGAQFIVDLSIQFLSSWKKGLNVTVWEKALSSTLLLALVGVLVFYFHRIGLQGFFSEEREDSEQAVSLLAQKVQANDLLYVHASMREQFKFYSQVKPVLTASLVYGTVGSPCCPRKEYRDPRQETLNDVARELVALSKTAAGQTVWVLLTARTGHWLYLRRNDIELFRRGLASLGCRKIDETGLAGVYIGRFQCEPV